MRFEYFVTYFHFGGKIFPLGFGHCLVVLDHKVRTYDDIELLEDLVRTSPEAIADGRRCIMQDYKLIND